MASNEVVINFRTRGSRQAANEVRGLSTALNSMGRQASRNASIGLGQVTRAARYASLGIAGLAGFSIKAGIQFNASMEQNEVAFTSFLGSAKAAREELAFLYKTAAVTPFQVGDITAAGRQLLSYGFSVKRTNSLLLSVGDAIAGAGLGPDAITMLIRDIGQIKGKGKLMAQELNQLGELGVLDRADFAKNLGITTAELANAGEQGIDANRAIRALQKTLNDRFGGASAEQAKTFNGQISTLKDNLNIMLGTITKPGFDALRTRVLPALGRVTKDFTKIADRKDIDLAEKITLGRAALRRRLGPIVRDIRTELGRMNLGPTLSKAFEDAVPKIAEAAGRAAPKIGKAFWDAFWEAGPFGKAALGFGAFKLLGGGGALGGISGVMGPIGAGSKFNPIVVTGIGGVPGTTITPGPKGGLGGKLKTAAKFGVVGLGPYAAVAGGGMLIDHFAGGGEANDLLASFKSTKRLPGESQAAYTNRVVSGHATAHPESKLARALPGNGRGGGVPPLQLFIDGKQVEASVRRREADRKARR